MKQPERTGAEAFLYRAWDLHDTVLRDLERVERLQSAAQRMTASISGDRVQTAPRSDTMEKTILELDEARSRLAADKAAETEAGLALTHLIDRLGDETARKVLDRRCLCYMTWPAAARDLNYSERYARRVFRAALPEVESLLAE